MSLSKIRGFIFEIYYKRIGFSDESSYYSMKRLKKKDLWLLANKLSIAKEHYQSFIRKKNKKSVKQSEIITYPLKNFGIVDINRLLQNIQKLHIIIQDYKTS